MDQHAPGHVTKQQSFIRDYLPIWLSMGKNVGFPQSAASQRRRKLRSKIVFPNNTASGFSALQPTCVLDHNLGVVIQEKKEPNNLVSMGGDDGQLKLMCRPDLVPCRDGLLDWQRSYLHAYSPLQRCALFSGACPCMRERAALSGTSQEGPPGRPVRLAEDHKNGRRLCAVEIPACSTHAELNGEGPLAQTELPANEAAGAVASNGAASAELREAGCSGSGGVPARNASNGISAEGAGHAGPAHYALAAAYGSNGMEPRLNGGGCSHHSAGR
eukprot:scaffold72773_cov20-Tisochrysis_lutea.AAC.1